MQIFATSFFMSISEFLVQMPRYCDAQVIKEGLCEQAFRPNFPNNQACGSDRKRGKICTVSMTLMPIFMFQNFC